MERRIRRDVYSFRFRKPLPGSGVGFKNPEARSPLLVAIAGMHKDFSSHGTCERSRFLDDDQRSLQVPTGALFNATANSSATPMMVLVKRRESPRKMSMWRNDIPLYGDNKQHTCQVVFETSFALGKQSTWQAFLHLQLLQHFLWLMPVQNFERRTEVSTRPSPTQRCPESSPSLTQRKRSKGLFR